MKSRAVFQEFYVIGSTTPIVIHMGFEPIDEEGNSHGFIDKAEQTIYDLNYSRNVDNGHE